MSVYGVVVNLSSEPVLSVEKRGAATNNIRTTGRSQGLPRQMGCGVTVPDLYLSVRMALVRRCGGCYWLPQIVVFRMSCGPCSLF